MACGSPTSLSVQARATSHRLCVVAKPLRQGPASNLHSSSPMPCGRCTSGCASSGDRVCTHARAGPADNSCMRRSAPACGVQQLHAAFSSCMRRSAAASGIQQFLVHPLRGGLSRLGPPQNRMW
eukprot:219475-Alexandrium_andersonii.AAC.1